MCSTTIFSEHTDAVSGRATKAMITRVLAARRRLHVPTHVARLDAPSCCLAPGRPLWAAPDSDRERNRGAKSFPRLSPRVESQRTRAYGG